MGSRRESRAPDPPAGAAGHSARAGAAPVTGGAPEQTAPATNTEFRALAAELGHDQRALDAGHWQTSWLRPETLRDLGALLVRADPDTRAARRSAFARLAGRSRTGQGRHDRGEAGIFSDRAVPEADARGLANHFPVRLKAISIPRLQLGPGEELDLSTRGSEWGVDPLEELYVLANVGECVLAPGARIVVRGNVFSLVIQDLHVQQNARRTRSPGDAVPDAHVGILPTPFPVDRIIDGPMDGPAGQAGAPGCHGAPGYSCIAEGSILGPIVDPASPPLARRHGEDGEPGAPGGRGGRGRTGGMSKIAELTVRSFTSGSAPLTVLARAGDGGAGGPGGLGGAGGDGGAPGAGLQGLAHTHPHGHPGRGGRGGDGGTGGAGGRGGLSSLVFVECPPAETRRIRALACPGRGGAGGAGGAPGGGGRHAPPGQGVALAGTPGRDGVSGRDRPAPAIFVNGEQRCPVEPMDDGDFQ